MWMVSARSVLEPRFLASVSLRCSLSVFGVVVLLKGYFLLRLLLLLLFFSSSILSRKSVGTSRDLLAMSCRNWLFLESSDDFLSLIFTSPFVSLLVFLTYKANLSSDGFLPRLLIKAFFFISSFDGGVLFL